MNEKKEMQKEKALVSVEQYTPSALLALAIQKNVDLERLKTLMDLQERYDANEAKKAFTKAMTEFKKNPPKIIKDMLVQYQTEKGITAYTHASLGNVVGAITEGLSKHQMSVNWKTKQENGKIEVTCFLTHVQGHTESTSLNASPDISGKKNPIQAVGSASTYLKRYTLLDIVGLATNECETDGNISEPVQKAGKKPAPKKELSFLDKAKIAYKWLNSRGMVNEYAGTLDGFGFKSAKEIKDEVVQQEVLKMLHEVMVSIKESEAVNNPERDGTINLGENTIIENKEELIFLEKIEKAREEFIKIDCEKEYKEIVYFQLGNLGLTDMKEVKGEKVQEKILQKLRKTLRELKKLESEVDKIVPKINKIRRETLNGALD